MDMKKVFIFVLSVLAILAISLPAAASFAPDARPLSADSSIKSVTPFDGSVVRAQQVRDPTGAAGISRQEVTGEETPVTMNYNPYYPVTTYPAWIPNWWGSWGWGGPGWGGWSWPSWNTWGGYW
ncbi:hypothetical protein MCP_1204 [Methanocella paludicola SANAE]|uniref:Uncharacterized protein n=1 Tax=Methanocella paludicola (strain DSM 17711 / JCM 13418 / NBRC 101707 / SANAE) TaxID=304371 RepID=D1YXV4_METPS|nr:hypothetical protein [Methanocella paludicola]BAI61276.1 hypothetical protein MCP_1204 [Methanocella paludicola SANAE]